MASRATQATIHATSSRQDDLWQLITPREREVLSLYMIHFNDKKVAGVLGTRLQTVRNQLASIQHKLNADCRADLVAKVLA